LAPIAYDFDFDVISLTNKTDAGHFLL